MIYVSPDVYDLLMEMKKEGKLDIVDNPKVEYLIEFYERLQALKAKTQSNG